MKIVWAWVAGIVLAACILGLVFDVRAPRNDRGAAYVVIHATTEQQAERVAPPGDWLLIRRIPRP